MKDGCATAWAAGAAANAAKARAPTATAEARVMRWVDGMSQFPFPVVPYWLTLRGRAAKMTACAGDGPARAAPPVTERGGPRFETVTVSNEKLPSLFLVLVQAGRSAVPAGAGPVQPGQVGVVGGEVLLVVDAAVAWPGGRRAARRHELVEVRLACRLQPA